jgi:hypothetical protein
MLTVALTVGFIAFLAVIIFTVDHLMARAVDWHVNRALAHPPSVVSDSSQSDIGG